MEYNWNLLQEQELMEASSKKMLKDIFNLEHNNNSKQPQLLKQHINNKLNKQLPNQNKHKQHKKLNNHNKLPHNLKQLKL